MVNSHLILTVVQQIPGRYRGVKKKLRPNIYLKNSYLPTIICESRAEYQKLLTHMKLMVGIIWVFQTEKSR